MHKSSHKSTIKSNTKNKTKEVKAITLWGAREKVKYCYCNIGKINILIIIQDLIHIFGAPILFLWIVIGMQIF